MRNKTNTDQLRWVVLLLATAVVLPTVCLLWFMTQAVKNERVVMRSRLTSVYTWETHRAFGPFIEWINAENLKARPILFEHDSGEAFERLAQNPSEFPYAGLVIVDPAGSVGVYPVPSEGIDEPDRSDVMQTAWRLEFVEGEFDAALREVERLEQNAPDPVFALRCRLTQARLLHKQGKIEEALAVCERMPLKAAESGAFNRFYAVGLLKTLDLLREPDAPASGRAERVTATLKTLFSVIQDNRLDDSEFRIFLFERAMGCYEANSGILTGAVAADLTSLSQSIEMERRSLEFLERHPAFEPGKKMVLGLERIEGSSLYALNLHAGQKKAVKLIDAEGIVQTLSKTLNFSGDVHYRIVTADGKAMVGAERETQGAFLEIPVTPIPGIMDWTVKLYSNDAAANIFEQAARRQSSVYTWMGVMVVVLVALAGSASIRGVGRQIRMNRLKNNFIATVTHELKTPLSSMRLLVDTLLDGGYTDPTQCREYLEMICRENHRLSRMIDSFLTFSRMERGKQVFEMHKVSPAEIATAAAEAVQAKFHEKKCRFSVTADAGLASIRVDKDAMVTVLVNLLDNACKYSGDNKDISLRVFRQDPCICFSVADNGIGMTRRQIKRIFDKFYQADSSLARRAEGCGLGLSIVKYILDAHKADIMVDSKVGKGSVLTVRIPTG